MAVTGIKSCANFTNATVTLKLFDGWAGEPKHSAQVAPNDTVGIDWWVPWADDQA